MITLMRVREPMPTETDLVGMSMSVIWINIVKTTEIDHFTNLVAP